MNAPLVVLFDVDGTLMTSGGAGRRSWSRAFEELHGTAVDVGEHSEPGMTDPEVARRSFVGALGREPAARELVRVMARYVERLPGEVSKAEGYRVMDGAVDIVAHLCHEGVLVGMTTGLLEGAARAKLERSGLNPYLCFGGYGSDSGDRAELTRAAIRRATSILGSTLDPSDVLVVGDTPKDVAAARAAGARSLAVATGAYTVEELTRAEPDAVVPSLVDGLPDLGATVPEGSVDVDGPPRTPGGGPS